MRQLGAVVPDDADKILTDGKLCVLFLGKREELCAEARVDDAAVKAERAALGSAELWVFHDRRYALFTHAVSVTPVFSSWCFACRK